MGSLTTFSRVVGTRISGERFFGRKGLRLPGWTSQSENQWQTPSGVKGKAYPLLYNILRLTRSPAARFLSTMTTAQAPPKQNGIENSGPIRSSSRLKEGRALAQDVWSIYKYVLVTHLSLRTELPFLIAPHLS